MSKLNDQQKYVLSVLSSCSSWKYKKINEDDDVPVPLEVLKARAVVARFEKKKVKRKEKASRDYGRKTAAVRKEIYFGSVTKALKLAEALLKECGE